MLLAWILAMSLPPAATAAQAPAAAAGQAAAPAPVRLYVPERVYDTRRRVFTDFEEMAADLARADVVLVGEEHDDPNTHRLEAALLQGWERRGVPIAVSLEMFERDTQNALDAYLDGKSTEEEFLSASRPWPRYATDYRELVELARTHGWPVIAANVPRRIAQTVAKSGKDAVDALPDVDRALVARELQCPRDAYFERFAESMNSHPASGQDEKTVSELTERYYWSQCVKDETMAESIARAFDTQKGRKGLVVHYTGAFHSDFGFGTAERVRRRLPGRRVAIVSIRPVADLDTLAPDEEELERAEYLVYTIRAPKTAPPPER